MQCDHFTRKSQLSMVERPLAIDLNRIVVADAARAFGRLDYQAESRNAWRVPPHNSVIQGMHSETFLQKHSPFAGMFSSTTSFYNV